MSFRYLLVLYVNWSVKHLKFALKWPISCFQPILVAIFVTIATIEIKLIQDYYTLVVSSYKLIRANSLKVIFIF